MSASEAIFGKVTQVLMESLNVDEGDITPTATLQGDLVLRLEREFDIRIPRGELFPESVFQGDPDFVRDGRVTEQGMGELRSRMPYADLSAFDQDRRLTAVPDLFTVRLVVRYVEWKLGKCVEVGPNGAGAIPVTSNASGVHWE